MRQTQQQALRFENGSVAYRDHSGDFPVDHLHRVGHRHPRRHAIGKRIRARSGNGLAGLERQRIAGRPFGLNADDIGRKAKRVTHRGHAADSRTEPDGYVNCVKRPGRREQFQGVGRDALHKGGIECAYHVQPFGGGQLAGMLKRRLKVVAVDDQLGALGDHRGVLFRVVSLGHTDHGA